MASTGFQGLYAIQILKCLISLKPKEGKMNTMLEDKVGKIIVNLNFQVLNRFIMPSVNRLKERILKWKEWS